MIHYIQLGANGQIINAGSSGGFADTAALLAAVPNAVIVPNPGINPFTMYWDGSRAIAKGVGMSPHHVFNYANKAWEDPRNLQALKEAKWADMKAAREAAFDAPLVTPYGTFDSDEKARTNITDAVLMLQTLAGMGSPTTIDFTLANNTTVTLTTAQMVTVGLLLGQKVQTAHATSRAKRAAIDAATNLSQLGVITWAI